MKRNVSLLNYFTALVFLLIPAFGQDLYDINTITNVKLVFSESNWDELLDDLKSEGNEERLEGTAIINDITFESVGVRYKGNSSYSSSRVKNPFNIKLDYIYDDQKYDNYGTLKLANVYNDPSFIRETLGYEIARDYMPASKANYAKVWVNDTYIGLYTSVQDVDKYFLRSNFYSDENAFFKGELTSSFPSVVEVWEYFGDDSDDYTDYYELDSDDGWDDLINFLDVFNNETDSMENVLNVDRHLWMLAYDNLFVNLDAPINYAHNYYLYKDDAGGFNPIIWDLNENFGVFSMLIGGDMLSTSELQNLSPYLNSSNSDYPIIKNVLNNSTYKKMYVAHMKTIIEDYISNDYYRDRALEIQAIIDDEVNDDPNKFYSYDNFLDNIDDAVVTGSDRFGQNSTVIGISQLMETRVSYLLGLSDFSAESPEISGVEEVTAASANSNIWISATVSDAETVYLAYQSSTTEKYKWLEMLDDGNSNDGEDSDGTYGVSVPTGTSGFDYYIYAENDDAGAFSPDKAAFEVYSVSVTNDLVINEFMASNDSYVTDSEGEYDDWIELYNNSDSDISLEGYFLSDDAEELDLWAFPDTFIAANNYLIIWADKDDEQPGLHADLKLSASGESLFLCDPDISVVDEVSFGEQTEDLSYGRYPNGTGDFIEMTPSFSTENIGDVTSIDSDDEQIVDNFSLEQNYPNPFNPTTTIQFSIPSQLKVDLNIYDIMGKKVKTLVSNNYAAGNYNVTWDGTDDNGISVSSGIYLYQIKAGSEIAVKKMSFMK